MEQRELLQLPQGRTTSALEVHSGTVVAGEGGQAYEVEAAQWLPSRLAVFRWNRGATCHILSEAQHLSLLFMQPRLVFLRNNCYKVVRHVGHGRIRSRCYSSLVAANEAMHTAQHVARLSVAVSVYLRQSDAWKSLFCAAALDRRGQVHPVDFVLEPLDATGLPTADASS
jgi:hypothetical protein